MTPAKVPKGQLFFVDESELVYRDETINPDDPEWVLKEERER